MIRPELEALLQGALDGTLTHDERALQQRIELGADHLSSSFPMSFQPSSISPMRFRAL